MGMNSAAPPPMSSGGAPPPPGGPPPGGGMMQAGIMPGGQSFAPTGQPPPFMTQGPAPGGESWAPKTGGPPVGGPMAGQMQRPQISPEGFNAYKRLQAMPIQGKQSKHAYNQAAMGFRNQYGGGYDPTGQLTRTKALRRYGG
jgi:hypothetical protein